MSSFSLTLPSSETANLHKSAPPILAHFIYRVSMTFLLSLLEKFPLAHLFSCPCKSDATWGLIVPSIGLFPLPSFFQTSAPHLSR